METLPAPTPMTNREASRTQVLGATAYKMLPSTKRIEEKISGGLAVVFWYQYPSGVAPTI